MTKQDPQMCALAQNRPEIFQKKKRLTNPDERRMIVEHTNSFIDHKNAQHGLLDGLLNITLLTRLLA